MNLRFRSGPEFAGVSGEMVNQHNLHRTGHIQICKHETLLVDKRRLSFSHFKIAFNLLADKHWRHGRVKFVTEILKLTWNNVS